jgi:hypothetical protein
VLKIGLRVLISLFLVLGVAVAPALALEGPAVPAGSWLAEDAEEIDAGFNLLYNLKAAEARAQFAVWQKAHPEDPLGSASEAASYLFEECYQQGVLTSEFFLDDSRFLGNDPLKPNQALRAAFFAADQRAQDLARRRLEADPNDAKALLAMTLSLGMRAD